MGSGTGSLGRFNVTPSQLSDSRDSAGGMKEQFEEAIRRLTEPINGQYPRPWMTEMKRPWEADVFIVGKNQRTPRHDVLVDTARP